MTQAELSEEMKNKIDALTHEEMARQLCYGPAEYPLLRGAAHEYFWYRFEKLGGFTPEISERLWRTVSTGSGRKLP